METVVQWIVGMFIMAEGIRDLLRRNVSVISVICVALFGLVLQFWDGNFNLPEVMGGIAVGGGFLLLAKLTDEAIGYGDGLMMAATGIVLGFRGNILLVCVAFALCAAVSVILLIFRKAGKKTVLPFVSFLFPAYVVVCMI